MLLTTSPAYAHGSDGAIAAGLGILWLAVLLSGISKWHLITGAIKNPGLWSFRLIVVDLLAYLGTFMLVVILFAPGNLFVMLGIMSVIYFCLVISIYVKLFANRADPSTRMPRLLLSTAILPSVIMGMAVMIAMWTG